MAAEQGAIKKKAAARSWILFDSKGEGTILDVDKYAIMHRVEIHARDLRILDPLLSYPSTILGRERAIVLNLEHIKAIITAEEVLLRDPTDENVVPVVEELKRRLPPSSAQNDVDAPEEDESPFEFRALEVALEAICSFLDARTTELETAAYPALDELTSKISSRNLDRVRKLKSAMTRLNARVQKVRDELEQLLDDDDDMADLYLSRKMVSSPVTGSTGPAWLPTSNISVASRISRLSRASAATVHGNNENDVEELEMLLESGDPERDGNVGSEPRRPGLADLYLSRKMVSSPITGSAGSTSNISVASRISRLSRASAATVHGNENDAEELEMLLEDFTIEQGQRGDRRHRNENDVEELEVLLEAYFMQIDGTLNKLTTLREYIDDTEDYINIQLDNHRNQLIQLELFLSSGTVCLSLYSLVAGIFGMNIPYSWNSGHGYLYKWVVMISGFICIFVFIAIVAYARHKGLVGS